MKRLLLITLLYVGWHTLLFAEKIDNYKIDVTVEQSGELSIVETIDYNFEGASKHGIFRDIPYQIKIGSTKKDIGIYQASVQMDGMPVMWEKSSLNSSQAGQFIRLKILRYK